MGSFSDVFHAPGDACLVCRPTVEARNALAGTASRMAEDVRVQIRKHHQASVKKGKYEKHSVELEAVSGCVLVTSVGDLNHFCI